MKIILAKVSITDTRVKGSWWHLSERYILNNHIEDQKWMNLRATEKIEETKQMSPRLQTMANLSST